MLLDEFPALGNIPAMERNMANLAGYGVRALLCAQDESQVIRVYGDDHALAANCQLRVYSASLSARSVERERDAGRQRGHGPPRHVARRRLVRQGDDLADGGRDARWSRPASW